MSDTYLRGYTKWGDQPTYVASDPGPASLEEAINGTGGDVIIPPQPRLEASFGSGDEPPAPPPETAAPAASRENEPLSKLDKFVHSLFVGDPWRRPGALETPAPPPEIAAPAAPESLEASLAQHESGLSPGSKPGLDSDIAEGTGGLTRAQAGWNSVPGYGFLPGGWQSPSQMLAGRSPGNALALALTGAYRMEMSNPSRRGMDLNETGPYSLNPDGTGRGPGSVRGTMQNPLGALNTGFDPRGFVATNDTFGAFNLGTVGNTGISVTSAMFDQSGLGKFGPFGYGYGRKGDGTIGALTASDVKDTQGMAEEAARAEAARAREAALDAAAMDPSSDEWGGVTWDWGAGDGRDWGDDTGYGDAWY